MLARPSGTEPMVRIYAEAREESRAEELAEAMEEKLLNPSESIKKVLLLRCFSFKEDV